MRARQAICHALIFAAIPLTASGGDDPPAGPPAPRPARKPALARPRPASSGDGSNPASPAAPAPNANPTLPALPPERGDGKAVPATSPATNPPPTVDPATVPMPSVAPPTPVVSPGSPAEAGRTRAGTEARLRDLDAADKKDNPATKPLKATLERRLKLLDEWKTIAAERDKVEHPHPSPEELTAEFKADLEKTRALLDQATKTPAVLLPETFGTPAPGAAVKPPEARLAEMKEAIDTARQELKDRSAELEKLRGEMAKNSAGDVANLRVERDKVHQSLSALTAARGEREAAITSAGSAEARDLAREQFNNYEWECRVEAERLARKEAQIALAARQNDLAALQVQAKASHVDLDRRLLDLMEKRYASQSERQQNDLKQAVAKEETRAAHTEDVLEKYRAKRTAELLELESQAVAYEKAAATSPPGLSVSEQSNEADKVSIQFESLKTLLNDGNVSPLDVLLLKNEFRRTGPERAAIVRNELAEVKKLLMEYETALADIEISLVNDARDDRYDRDSLLDKLPEKRHPAAEAMLETMEARHLALLNRLQHVLQVLARETENTQAQILRRIAKLDEQYAFIRTHIFWVRDAEPVGPATLDHAGDEADRLVKALVKLCCELGDKSLWGRVAPDFILALVALVILPWPFRLARQAMDRLRLAAPDPTMTPQNAPSAVVG